MNRPKILVTAAAGHTGTAAVHQLLQMGFPVRAFVRRRDDRATALEQAGAELFIGDVFDYRDLRASMVGVQRAYHCPPFGLNLLHNTMLFAVAAEEAEPQDAGRQLIQHRNQRGWTTKVIIKRFEGLFVRLGGPGLPHPAGDHRQYVWIIGETLDR